MKIILTGKKVCLRELMANDAASLSKNMSDREFIQYIGFEYPFTPSDALKLILKYRKEMQKGTSYVLGIEEKGKSAIIGVVAFVLLDSTKSPALDYWLGREFWRRGYTEEAVRLIITLGFRKLKLKKIYSAAYQKNKASNNLLLKVGFKEYKRRFKKFKGSRVKQIMYVMNALPV